MLSVGLWGFWGGELCEKQHHKTRGIHVIVGTFWSFFFLFLSCPTLLCVCAHVSYYYGDDCKTDHSQS